MNYLNEPDYQNQNLIQKTTSSAKQNNNTQIIVYPNPAKNGRFTIDLERSIQPANLFIYNIFGKCLLHQKNADAVIQVNLPNYKGLLFIKVETNNQIRSTKLLLD